MPSTYQSYEWFVAAIIAPVDRLRVLQHVPEDIDLARVAIDDDFYRLIKTQTPRVNGKQYKRGNPYRAHWTPTPRDLAEQAQCRAEMEELAIVP